MEDSYIGLVRNCKIWICIALLLLILFLIAARTFPLSIYAYFAFCSANPTWVEAEGSTTQWTHLFFLKVTMWHVGPQFYPEVLGLVMLIAAPFEPHIACQILQMNPHTRLPEGLLNWCQSGQASFGNRIGNFFLATFSYPIFMSWNQWIVCGISCNA